MKKSAFSLVELMVAVTILVILSSIGFISYSAYVATTRDTQRKAHLAEIKGAMKTHKQIRGLYPEPTSPFEINYNGTSIVKQGQLGTGLIVSGLEVIPLDPRMDWPYTYSVTTPNRTEYQIALTLENSNLPMALVGGDYESVARTVLPTIVVATGSINVVGNQRYFIFNEQSSNLPYTFSTPRAPRATREEGDGPPTNFYQSSHFWSCDEIKAAGKYIVANSGSIMYQIVGSTGSLMNVYCNMN